LLVVFLFSVLFLSPASWSLSLFPADGNYVCLNLQSERSLSFSADGDVLFISGLGLSDDELVIDLHSRAEKKSKSDWLTSSRGTFAYYLLSKSVGSYSVSWAIETMDKTKLEAKGFFPFPYSLEKSDLIYFRVNFDFDDVAIHASDGLHFCLRDSKNTQSRLKKYISEYNRKNK